MMACRYSQNISGYELTSPSCALYFNCCNCCSVFFFECSAVFSIPSADNENTFVTEGVSWKCFFYSNCARMCSAEDGWLDEWGHPATVMLTQIKKLTQHPMQGRGNVCGESWGFHKNHLCWRSRIKTTTQGGVTLSVVFKFVRLYWGSKCALMIITAGLITVLFKVTCTVWAHFSKPVCLASILIWTEKNHFIPRIKITLFSVII